MSSSASSSMTSTTSSTVITPTSRPSSSTTGRGDEIVALEKPRHVLLVVGRLHRLEIGIHDFRDRRRPLAPEQPVERHRADQVIGRIDHEEHVELVGQLRLFAHVVDRPPDVPERRHGDEVRLHQPAGRLLRIVEAALDGGALDRRHLGEDLRLLLRLEVLEEADRIVGIRGRGRLRPRSSAAAPRGSGRGASRRVRSAR